MEEYSGCKPALLPGRLYHTIKQSKPVKWTHANLALCWNLSLVPKCLGAGFAPLTTQASGGPRRSQGEAVAQLHRILSAEEKIGNQFLPKSFFSLNHHVGNSVWSQYCFICLSVFLIVFLSRNDPGAHRYLLCLEVWSQEIYDIICTGILVQCSGTVRHLRFTQKNKLFNSTYMLVIRCRLMSTSKQSHGPPTFHIVSEEKR